MRIEEFLCSNAGLWYGKTCPLTLATTGRRKIVSAPGEGATVVEGREERDLWGTWPSHNNTRREEIGQAGAGRGKGEGRGERRRRAGKKSGVCVGEGLSFVVTAQREEKGRRR